MGANLEAQYHRVSDPSIVWYGGMGHRKLSVDGGMLCYQCGMVAENDAWQELIPDCQVLDGEAQHHSWTVGYSWQSEGPRNECAYGDAWITPDDESDSASHSCARAL